MSLLSTTSPDDYFATARTEIMPWLPEKVSRMLDLGCGTGATTQLVKSCRTVTYSAAVELMADKAERARAVCDHVWTGDINALVIEDDIAPGSLNLVLCLDVLEHLADPWTIISRLSALLAPGGRLILSVPNIRNYRFIWRLAMRGDFHYRDFGLLDRTHLRFFVRSTASELATSAGLSLLSATSVQSWRAPDWRWFANRLTRNYADEWLAKQWLVVAEKRP